MRCRDRCRRRMELETDRPGYKCRSGLILRHFRPPTLFSSARRQMRLTKAGVTLPMLVCDSRPRLGLAKEEKACGGLLALYRHYAD